MCTHRKMSRNKIFHQNRKKKRWWRYGLVGGKMIYLKWSIVFTLLYVIYTSPSVSSHICCSPTTPLSLSLVGLSRSFCRTICSHPLVSPGTFNFLDYSRFNNLMPCWCALLVATLSRIPLFFFLLFPHNFFLCFIINLRCFIYLISNFLFTHFLSFAH